MGVPTGGIEGEVFGSLGEMYSGLVGMPVRLITVPFPISRLSRDRCREVVNGNDPVKGRPIIEELISALTTPLNEEEKRSGIEERTEPHLIGPDTEDNINQLFIDNIWTDFLPIVLPTEKRVEEMLKGTSHDPDEVVGEMRSGYESCTFTVEQVAANAVMAGAKPDYLPVILALAESGVPAITTSTQSFGRMIVVNGPIAKEIGMNSGTGALSPMNRANAVIGRAATLISINLGAGAVPNRTYYGSQGNVTDYNHVTFAENEAFLPEGWNPFHVQIGFEKNESAVSMFHGYTIWHWKDTFERRKIDALVNMAGRPLPSGAYKSGISFLLDPIVANDLVGEGFATKESVRDHIYEQCLISLDEYWQYHLVEGFSRRMAEKGVEPYASWLSQTGDTMVNRYRSPDEISILVVGGRTNDFWQAGDFHLIGSFSIDEWR
jgi:hypothetical protein